VNFLIYSKKHKANNVNLQVPAPKILEPNFPDTIGLSAFARVIPIIAGWTCLVSSAAAKNGKETIGRS